MNNKKLITALDAGMEAAAAVAAAASAANPNSIVNNSNNNNHTNGKHSHCLYFDWKLGLTLTG